MRLVQKSEYLISTVDTYFPVFYQQYSADYAPVCFQFFMGQVTKVESTGRSDFELIK